ncbi:MAG: ABC transporter ATP-binding protein [Chloroflexota bacterium]|nr:ABC transporter ATP-binding protein [Chloroflexota bacterium]
MEQPEPLDLAIEMSGLTKRFGQLTAVDQLDLVVKRGSIFGLVGPDGAGKTTTLRMLCGALVPTAGTARVAGFDVVRQTELARLQLGYMPQSFSLYPDLSVQENLEFFADVYEVPRALRQARMDKLLEFSRLAGFRGRRAEHLSGGMKKKLALACTLIHEPRVLLLDEPTTGVDPVSRRELWHILYELLRSGVTTVVTTPYMDEAERCNRVGFLMAGRLLVSGTPSELADLPRRMVVELKARPRKVMQAVAHGAGGVDNIQIFGDRLHLLAADPAAVMASLQEALEREGAQILTLRTVRPSMEDVFMHLAQEGGQRGPERAAEIDTRGNGNA